jgi:hypothetical protein
MLHAIVHAANIQDRDGGAMATTFGLFSFLLKLYADDGYQGPAFRNALAGIFWGRARPNVCSGKGGSGCCPATSDFMGTT